jgi:hypothetical protein
MSPTPQVATITWKAPSSDNGLALLSATSGWNYEVKSGTTSAGSFGPATAFPGPIAFSASTSTFSATTHADCLAPVSAGGCTYRIQAVNRDGAGAWSMTSVATFHPPTPVATIAISTIAVDMTTGNALQSVSWSPSANSGGLPVQYTPWRCSTASGSSCDNSSKAWTLAGPSGTSTSIFAACPPNGRCSYEIWSTNSKGTTYALNTAHPAEPSSLKATPDPTVGDQIDLSWAAPIDTGMSPGHYKLFICNSADSCDPHSSAVWSTTSFTGTNWTETDVTADVVHGIGTTTYTCGIGNTCTFAVGYIDATPAIGGVSFAPVTLDRPDLSAMGAAPPPGVDLSWTPASVSSTIGTIAGYEVDRQNGTSWTLLALRGADQTTYTDATCATGATCTYRVRAKYSSGSWSTYSVQRSATGS